ncbi:MAG: glycosyltransferase family 4 protein [Chloroflexi bacterium]|nr:glycosyltransferase family 4 protein [Chloroflexota bacterium]
MRIALLTPELKPAYGWASYALDLANALSSQGIEVVALTQSGASETVSAAAAIEIRPVLPQLMPPVRGFARRSLTAITSVRRAAADCDLLHATAEPYALLAALAAGSRPMVTTAHGTYVPMLARRRGIGRLYRMIFRRSHLIAVSNYTATQVRAALPGVEVTVIRNGVHFAKFQVPQPPPDKTGPTILASGGVKSRKGTHLLIEALARVRELIPDAQLVVTGGQTDVDYLERVRQRVEQLGLESCVHLVGMIPEADLLAWYQHADVFALPSLSIGGKFEGFGLVFLEASASGLPVIGTTGSGVEEAILNDKTGLLIPQNDVPALVETISRLLQDAALRATMGAAGRDYARSQDWAAVAGRVADEYRKILK